jgi:hypothetical protein
LFQVPPAIIVASPVNNFVPTTLVNDMIPATEVVPLTVILKPPTLKVDPLAILKLAQAASAAVVTVNPPSIKTLSPAIGKLAPGAPPDVAAHVEMLFQLPVATEYLSAAISENPKNDKTTARNNFLQVSVGLIMISVV